jgi:hypothetical protein
MPLGGPGPGIALAAQVAAEVQRRENNIKYKPDLTYREPSPPSITFYLKMQHGKFTQQNTGVFIPDVFTAQPTVNLILYLHGNAVRVTEGATSIKQFWGGKAGRVFPLRERLNDSKQKYILVAPSVGSVDQFLKDLPANIDFFFNQVMAALYMWGPLVGLSNWGTNDAPPQLGDVILAGHSGAGRGMMQIANKIDSHVKEVWGFDTLHNIGVDDLWADFALAHTKTARVYLYYATYSERSIAMQKKTAAVDSVFIIEGAEVKEVSTRDGKTQLKVTNSVSHDYLIQHFWLERLNNIGNPSQIDLKRREETRKAAKD